MASEKCARENNQYLLVHFYQSQKCIHTLKYALEAKLQDYKQVFVCHPACLPASQTTRTDLLPKLLYIQPPFFLRESDRTFVVLMLIPALSHGIYFQLPFFYGCEPLEMSRDVTPVPRDL